MSASTFLLLLLLLQPFSYNARHDSTARALNGTRHTKSTPGVAEAAPCAQALAGGKQARYKNMLLVTHIQIPCVLSSLGHFCVLVRQREVLSC
jgi:hypothetical protein